MQPTALGAFAVGILTLLVLFLAEMCSASGKQLLADCRDDKLVLSRRYVFALHGRGACAEANYELARRMGRGGFAQHCERCYHQ